MSILQNSALALLTAGIGLALNHPVRATEAPNEWMIDDAASARPTQALQVPINAVPPQSIATMSPPPAAPRAYAMTPERKALLNTIRYSEGTWANGTPLGYRVMFGGGLMPSLDRHPDRVIRSGGYASAAAGAYQFMPFTWSMVTRALGLSRFEPDEQDQAAIYLIHRRGALHLADRGEMTPELAAKLSPEWASFPTLAGNSYYGQPVKRFTDLKRFYDQSLAELRAGEQTRWQEVAIQPVAPACNDDSLTCKLQGITAKSTH